jgi:RHS repeat-associated protein
MMNIIRRLLVSIAFFGLTVSLVYANSSQGASTQFEEGTSSTAGHPITAALEPSGNATGSVSRVSQATSLSSGRTGTKAVATDDPTPPTQQLIGYARSATIEGQCRWPAVFGRTLQEFAEENVRANNAVTGLTCFTNCPNPDELVSIDATNNTYTVRSLCGGSLYVHPAPPVYSLKTTFHDCPNRGDPCNIPSGASIQTDVDYDAGQLGLNREYNSRIPSSFAGIMGTGWRLSYESSATNYSGVITAADVHTNGSVTFIRPSGQVILFKYDAGTQTWLPDADITARLQEHDDATGSFLGWSLYPDTSPLREDYDRNGRLTTIDRGNGNVVSLQYTSSSLLSSATDSTGRALQFHFINVGGVQQLGSVTLPSGLVITYVYNTNGQLQTVTYPVDTDGIAHFKTYGYVNGLLTSLTDEAGVQTSSWTFASDGSITSNILGPPSAPLSVFAVQYNTDGSAVVTSPLGHIAQLSSQIVLGVRHITGGDTYCSDCGSVTQSSNYDDNGRLAGQTDFRGVASTFIYDASGMETQRVEASGLPEQRTIQTSWNAFYKVPESRTTLDNNGNTVAKLTAAYNNRGQIVAGCLLDPSVSSAITYTCGSLPDAPAGARQTTYSYCDSVDSTQCPVMGLLLLVNGPRTDISDITSYSYYLTTDESGCAVAGGVCHRVGDIYQITDAIGHVTTMVAYDKNGRLVRSQDSNGVTTDLSYTPRGWLHTKSVAGAVTTVEYNPTGTVSKITDPDGAFVSYTYDAAHRLTDITDALANHIHYTLDASGHRIKEDAYDSGNVPRHTLSRNYNALGQLRAVTDGLSHTVFNADFGDSYDANGNLVHSSDGLDVQRKFGYDGLNRLVSTLADYNGADPATQNAQSSFAYDAQDNLEGITDPDGLSTSYDYDGLSNPKAVHSPDTGTTQFQVDAAGNSIQQIDAKGVVRSIIYDALNRPVMVSYPDSSQNVTYHYDESNSVTGCEESYPIGRLTRTEESAVTTIYCYDVHGNVVQKKQVQGGQADTVAYAYTPAGRLSSTTTPSGTVTQFSRDVVGRINAVTATPIGGAGKTLVSSISYLPFGSVSGYTLGNGQVVNRGYDVNYRLSDLTSAALSLHFLRDANGSITSLSAAIGADAVETYNYDSLRRLKAVNDANGNATETYTYSKTGDRLSKAKPGGLATGTYGYQSGTHWLTSIGNAARSYDLNGNTIGMANASGSLGFGYNARNRLALVQRDQQTIASYVYNAKGERVAKVVSSPQVVNERFAFDEGGQLLGEYGTTNRDYIWLGNLPVAVIDDGATATVSYVHADGLGVPRAIADEGGSVVWQWPYTRNPFGEQAPIGAYTYNLRFPGQYFDQETGLSYNIHRDYDGATGRYSESDPLGLRAGLSTYGYVGGNPLIRTDPLGLESPRTFCADGNTSAAGWKGCATPIPVCNRPCGCSNRNAAKYLNAAAIIMIAGGPEDPIGDIAAWEEIAAADAAEAVEGAELLANVAPRALTEADLGAAPGSLTRLEGTYSVTDGVANAQVDMIEGTLDNPIGAIRSLIEQAEADGATELNIQGSVANEQLFNILARRYGATTQGSTETITIPLGE